MRPFRSIAIDGPSGAGKSTLAKALAARLGFLYVDTGAIYRTVGLYVARQGGDCGDPQQVLPRLPELQLSLTYGADGLQHMLLAGEDVTQAIRENQVPGMPPRFPPTLRSVPSCWRCSATWPEPMMSSWMAGTSAPWSCPRRT